MEACGCGTCTSPDTSTPLTGDEDTDVAVVGAGIVGLTTALLAVRDGNRVIVLDGARAGTGTTGHTTGKVTAQHGLAYADLIQRVGHERAKQYADANLAGMALVAELTEELDLDCDLTTADALVYSRSTQDHERIAEEAEAAQRLGLPASLVTEAALPFPIDAGVRFDHQLHPHPGHYIAGLAAAFHAAGGILHEECRVTDVTESNDRVRLETDHGTVTAGHAILATLLPPGLTATTRFDVSARHPWCADTSNRGAAPRPECAVPVRLPDKRSSGPRASATAGSASPRGPATVTIPPRLGCHGATGAATVTIPPRLGCHGATAAVARMAPPSSRANCASTTHAAPTSAVVCVGTPLKAAGTATATARVSTRPEAC